MTDLIKLYKEHINPDMTPYEIHHLYSSFNLTLWVRHWDPQRQRVEENFLRERHALGLEIDREDNDLGYSPQNCRWVTKKVNSRNTRQVKLTEELVREIRYGKYKDTPQYIIAKLIGCTNSTINSVVWRKSWKDI